MTAPKPSRDIDRPRVVTVAYWLWLVAAVLAIILALLIFTVPADSLRDALADQGQSGSEIDSFLAIIRGSAAICLVVGLAIGFFAGPVKRGDARFRRALVALSGIFALLVLLASTILPPEVVVLSVLLAVASVLVYRPSAREWFVQ